MFFAVAEQQLQKLANKIFSPIFFDMSYRDLRNFTEMMRALGYPRLISLDNFRQPNFPLVAEILVWLVKRVDSGLDIPSEISKEEERVALIRSAAHLLALKAGLKLNTKKLYQADGYAVRELLKVTTLLIDSLRASKELETSTDDYMASPLQTALKASEVKEARKLVTAVTAAGAALHELLSGEAELRELRNTRAKRHLEMTQVETAVKEASAQLDRQIQITRQQIESVAGNEATLDSKIEKKKADLERHTKRLQTLRKIRPAFMEEFEKLEDELKSLYEEHVTKCRNVSWLENVLDQAEDLELKRASRKQAMTRKLLEDMKQEESLQSTDNFPDMLEEGAGSGGGRREGRLRTRVSALREAAVATDPVPRTRVFGNMTGDLDLDDSDSLDSESDLLLDGDLTEDDEPQRHIANDTHFSDDDF